MDGESAARFQCEACHRGCRWKAGRSPAAGPPAPRPGLWAARSLGPKATRTPTRAARSAWAPAGPRLPAGAPPRPWLPVPLSQLLPAACRAWRGALAAAEAERSRPASEPQPRGRELRPSHVPRRPFKQELRSRPGPRAHTAPPAARRTARAWPQPGVPAAAGATQGGGPPSLAWAAGVDTVGRAPGGCGPRADAARGAQAGPEPAAGWRGLGSPVSHPGIGPES